MRPLLAVGLALALSLAPAAAQTAPRRLTGGGCCVNPVWSADSKRVLFIDRPSAGAPTGLYSASLGAPGGAAKLEFSRVAYYSPDFAYAVIPGGSNTVIERLSDGRRFSLPTAAGNVAWSPGNQQLAWTVSSDVGNYDRRVGRVYVARLGGSPRQVATVYGGGAIGWLDRDILLLSGKAAPGDRERAVRALKVSTGASIRLVSATSPRGVAPSPDGKRVLYYIAFERPLTRNGLFLVASSGGPARRLPFFGSYRWRDARRVVYVPLEPGRTAHRLLEYDVTTGSVRILADLGTKISGDNWQVSPDGRWVVFLNAADRNLYTLELPRSPSSS